MLFRLPGDLIPDLPGQVIVGQGGAGRHGAVRAHQDVAAERQLGQQGAGQPDAQRAWLQERPAAGLVVRHQVQVIGDQPGAPQTPAHPFPLAADGRHAGPGLLLASSGQHCGQPAVLARPVVHRYGESGPDVVAEPWHPVQDAFTGQRAEGPRGRAGREETLLAEAGDRRDPAAGPDRAAGNAVQQGVRHRYPGPLIAVHADHKPEPWHPRARHRLPRRRPFRRGLVRLHDRLPGHPAFSLLGVPHMNTGSQPRRRHNLKTLRVWRATAYTQRRHTPLRAIGPTRDE